MAIQAGHTGIFIIRFTRMLVIHVCAVMFMAIDACKKGIVARIAVAFCATVPFIVMRS